MKITVLTAERSGATAVKDTFWHHNRCCQHQAILTQSQMNLGHSDGDNLDNFCASHEQPTRMQIGVVNRQRALFDNHKKKLRNWKSVRHSTKPHCKDNKCNNTYTGINTFTVGLALIPVGLCHSPPLEKVQLWQTNRNNFHENQLGTIAFSRTLLIT